MKTLLKATTYLTLSLLAVFAAHGQAARTWVSGVGDDANPCSRTAPCKTFAGAIAKTAAGGEIDVLDPGGFGAVTITKAITIDGGGQLGSVLVSGTNGLVIAAGSTDEVTIRNLWLTGIRQTGSPGLNGIDILAAGTVHIEHCSIANFGQNGILVTSSGTGSLVVENSNIRDNTGSGISIGSGSTVVLASVSNTTLENNSIGLLASGNSKVTVKNVVATGNTGAGFQADGSAASTSLNIANSISANNGGAGIQASSSGSTPAVVRITGVGVFSNATGLTAGTGGYIYSFGDNATTGSGTPTGMLSKQ